MCYCGNGLIKSLLQCAIEKNRSTKIEYLTKWVKLQRSLLRIRTLSIINIVIIAFNEVLYIYSNRTALLEQSVIHFIGDTFKLAYLKFLHNYKNKSA